MLFYKPNSRPILRLRFIFHKRTFVSSSSKSQWYKQPNHSFFKKGLLTIAVSATLGLSSKIVLEKLHVDQDLITKPYEKENKEIIEEDVKDDIILKQEDSKSQIIELLKRHWKMLLFSIFTSVLTTAVSIKLPLLISDIIKLISSSELTLLTLNSSVKNLMFWILLQSTSLGIHIFTVHYTIENIFMEIKGGLYLSILNRSFSDLEASRKGELAERIWLDFNETKNLCKMVLFKGIPCITTLLGTSYNLINISSLLSQYLIIVLPLIYGTLYVYGKILRKYRLISISKEANNQGLSNEMINSIRTIRSFSMEEEEAIKYSDNLKQLKHVHHIFSFHLATFKLLLNAFLGASLVSTFYLGGNLVLGNQLDPAQLVAYLLNTQSMQKSVDQLGTLLGQLLKGQKSILNVTNNLNLKPCSTLSSEKNLISQVEGNVTFNIKHFEYPNTKTNVLTNVDLFIPAGSTLALCGQSGTGKSTLVALLERFYELTPEQGEILIDNINIKDFNPKYLRTHIISYLEQEPTLFHGTIAQNICYGSQYSIHDTKQIRKAAEDANALQFIEKLPNGFNTVIGERGTSLSGGQKQRIAIARAIIKDPKILILDEATSALDTLSEKKVQKALNQVMQNRTTIVIAHRLSTIQNSDCIVLLQPAKDKDSILEIGSHNQLMDKKGNYYRLFHRLLEDEAFA